MNKLFQAVTIGDVKLFYLFNQRIKCKILDLVMPRITHLGGALFTLTLTSLLVFLGNEKIEKIGWEALLALLSSGIIVQVIKKVVNRTRPYRVLKEVNLISPPFCRHSFPSGHTTAIFSLAIIFGANFPNFHFISQTLAGLVGISRAYVGVHYPSDIITGAVIGIYCSNWVHSLI